MRRPHCHVIAPALAGCLILLAGCDSSSGGAPGAVSEGEAEALEDAAEMLDERRLPDGALPPIDAPVTEPAPATTTPESNSE